MGNFFPGTKGKLELIGKKNGKGYNINFPYNIPKENQMTNDS